jgi:hypothetical protein
MESTASYATAQTRATKVTSARKTSMIASVLHVQMELSAMMVLRTTIAVVLKVMQVCNRRLNEAVFIISRTAASSGQN